MLRRQCRAGTTGSWKPGHDFQSSLCGTSARRDIWRAKIIESQMILFCGQDLILNGHILSEARSLKTSSINEGAEVEFSVRTSWESLIDSLQELLQARDLSLGELCLPYCYKHGVSINQVVQSIGTRERFSSFVSRTFCRGGPAVSRTSPCHNNASTARCIQVGVFRQLFSSCR